MLLKRVRDFDNDFPRHSLSIGPFRDLVTRYKVIHARTQVSKPKQLVPVHLDLPLFWKSHCATGVPACVILYYVPDRAKGFFFE